MLKIEHLSFAYNTNAAIIKDFSYAFQAGTKYFLQGKNGSGKSTFMKIVAGELSPTSGKLTNAAKSVVYIPQQFKLAANVVYTCEEFLSNMLILVTKKHLLTSSLIEQNYNNLLADFSFHELLKQNIAELSIGEQQKLLLIRALLSQANLYLFDEAWSALDVDTIAKLPQILEKYLPKNACLLQISHSQADLWSSYLQVPFPCSDRLQEDRLQENRLQESRLQDSKLHESKVQHD